MTFQNWINKNKPSKLYYEKDLLTWVIDEDSTWAKVHKSLQPLYEIGGASGLISYECLSKALAYGPKILQLNNVDFDLLEQTDVNIELQDYNQPFDTLVVDLPEFYAEKHRVLDPLVGTVFPINNILHKETTRPEFCIISKNEDILFITVYGSSADCYSMQLADQNLIIEQQLENKLILINSMTNEERDMYIKVVRTSLNAALFADDFGLHNDGARNPNYHNRLKRYVDVAIKSKDKGKIEKARKEYEQVPIYYSFKQDVKLKITRVVEGELREGGWTVKPHRRRGHFRIQRYGKGLTERKRIRINPVFVNEHLFQGDLKDTSTTLKD